MAVELRRALVQLSPKRVPAEPAQPGSEQLLCRATILKGLNLPGPRV